MNVLGDVGLSVRTFVFSRLWVVVLSPRERPLES